MRDADSLPPPSVGLVGRVRGAGTVLSDLASVSGARLGSAILSVLTVIMATRILAPQGYALIAYVTIISTLMFTTTSAWTASTVTRYGREELEQHGTITTTSWNRLLITAPLILASMAVVVCLKVAHALPVEITSTVVWLAIGSGVLLIASEHIVTLLEAAGRMRLTAITLTVRQCISTAILVIILLTGRGRSPVVIITLNVVALALVVAWMGTRVWSSGLWPPAASRALMRRMLAFSVPLIAFSASQYLIQSVDIVILRLYGTQSQVGIYAVAYQGYSVLQQVPTTSTIVLTPLFVSLAAARKGALVGLYVRRTVSQLLFLFAVAVGLAVPFLGIAVPIVFGEPFRGAARPLAVLLIALVLYAYASFLAPILLVHERTRAVAMVNLMAACVNVAGDFLFVGPLHMGLLGPAVATSLALAVICIGYLLVAERCTKTRASRNLALLSPLLLGVLSILLFEARVALAVGLPAVALVTGVILRTASPFDLSDADMILKLDMPVAFKGLLLRALRRIAK